jgi:hypothetical protein
MMLTFITLHLQWKHWQLNFICRRCICIDFSPEGLQVLIWYRLVLLLCCLLICIVIIASDKCPVEFLRWTRLPVCKIILLVVVEDVIDIDSQINRWVVVLSLLALSLLIVLHQNSAQVFHEIILLLHIKLVRHWRRLFGVGWIWLLSLRLWNQDFWHFSYVSLCRLFPSSSIF